jgi:hypothetical protein
VTTLAFSGAKHIAVSNLPPLNVYPELPLNLDESTVRQYVDDFNTLLTTEMATLEGQLGISIYQLDWHGLATDGRSDPTAYGLSNVTEAAWQAGGTASDPEQYLFWDFAHFTTSFQRFSGEMAAETIASQLSSVTLSQSSDADSSSTIFIHQVFNHADTPIEVIDLICKHELLHLRIPPIIEGKKEIQHPPEFWEAEREICPERNLAWSWIWINLDGCLKKRPRLERIDVLPAWKRKWCTTRVDVATFQKRCICGPVDEELGW